MLNRTDVDIEKSIQAKLANLRVFLDSLQRDQRGKFSRETDDLVLCLTSSIGKHFKNETLPLLKRETILNLALAVTSAAAKWVDQDDAATKDKALQTLIDKLTPLKNTLAISKTKTLFRLFEPAEMQVYVAAEDLINQVRKFKGACKNAEEKGASTTNETSLSDVLLEDAPASSSSFEMKKP